VQHGAETSHIMPETGHISRHCRVVGLINVLRWATWHHSILDMLLALHALENITTRPVVTVLSRSLYECVFELLNLATTSGTVGRILASSIAALGGDAAEMIEGFVQCSSPA
jgi:hypothetical protein